MDPEGHFAPDCISQITKSSKIIKFWRSMSLGCWFLDAGGHSNIFWSILTNDGMWAAWRMLGGGRLPPSPTNHPNCYLWGAPPLKLPIFYYIVIFGHPKKTRNEKMYIEMVECRLHLWRWIDSWPKRCLRFGHNYVPSTWYQVLGTRHLVPSIIT